VAPPPPSVLAALEEQLRSWRAALAGGARRVGWKLAYDIAEIEDVIGREPVVGHLTTATLLPSGGAFAAATCRSGRAPAWPPASTASARRRRGSRRSGTTA
jgi:hypothetical protein